MKVERVGWWRALFLERLPRCYRATGLHAFTIAGDCLRPWLLPDDVALVDTTLDPLDGELALISMKYRRSTTTLGAGVSYRVEPSIKQLVLIDDRPMLACATGMVSAARHDIAGVVVAVSRRGWRRAPMKDMDFRASVQLTKAPTVAKLRAV